MGLKRVILQGRGAPFAAFREIRRAVRPFKPAAMFALAREGHASTFEQLVGCLISIRTLDEVSLPAAKKLLTAAPTPQKMAALPVEHIDRLISASTFHRGKAAQIKEIARRTVQEFGGVIPCDENILLSFNGVGPKCANLVLGIACHIPKISVDIHVHRVTNRWGIVREKNPEATMKSLEALLPRSRWIELNKILVPFGKHICTLRSPKCSTCPILSMCRQVGVGVHR